MTRTQQILAGLALLCFAVFAVLTLLFDSYVIASPAMAPSVGEGDVILVRSGQSGSVGDIVTFDAPAFGLTIEEPQLAVGRIIAKGPDSILFEDDRVVVNDTLLDEPYLAAGTVTFSRDSENARNCTEATPTFCKLREGTVFLMGDNRPSSLDSRSYGPVEQAYVRGKVVRVGGPRFHVWALGGSILFTFGLAVSLINGRYGAGQLSQSGK